MSKRGESAEEVAGPRHSMSELVPVSALQVNPLNPKARSKPAPELVGSMRELGLLQPVVVLEKGSKLELLAGHRRLAAAKELGWSDIPAVKFKGDVSQAGIVLLAENTERVDFRPLEEAALVEALMENSTQEKVAAALGRSVKWVARRQNLTKLSPLAVKATAEGGPLSKWPPTWLEELALLGPNAQDHFIADEFNVHNQKEVTRGWFDDSNLMSVDDVREAVRKLLRPLRLAPWKLDDAKLVKSVGPCSTCPKTSCAKGARTLFDGEAGEADKIDEALCRDAVCWDGKAEAFLKLRVAELQKEHGPALAFVHDKRAPRATKAGEAVPELLPLEPLELDGVRPLHDYQWSPGTQKHGRPAVMVDGPKQGQVVWIAKNSDGSAKAGSAAHKGDGKPKSMKVKEGELEKRRQYHMVEQLADHVQNCAWDEVKGLPQFDSGEDAEVFLQVFHRALVEGLAFRFELLGGYSGLKVVDRFKPTTRAIEELWVALRKSAARVIGDVAKYRNSGDTPIDALDWFAKFTGFDLVDARERAEKDCPTPKSWGRDDATAAPKKSTKAGAKAGSKAARR